MEKPHFQWQNEHLKDTIYPLREFKLKDFLHFYQEFEIWEQYKDKNPQDEDFKRDVKTYLSARKTEQQEVHLE
jgi:hypothetical protein